MRAPVWLVSALAVAAVTLCAGCASGMAPDPSLRGAEPSEPRRLAPTEVREYQGEDLSSVDDFRENSIAGPQFVDRESYRLTIAGMVTSPRALSYDEVLELPSYEKVVTLDCVEGWSATILWEGVLLRDVLAKAGEYDTQASVVVLRAADGYSTSLPLAYLVENDILLAHRMNGVELPPQRGFPFQLVAEDRWGYKWIKWVTDIEVSDDETFRGYWESRGYSNSGMRDEGYRE